MSATDTKDAKPRTRAKGSKSKSKRSKASDQLPLVSDANVKADEHAQDAAAMAAEQAPHTISANLTRPPEGAPGKADPEQGDGSEAKREPGEGPDYSHKSKHRCSRCKMLMLADGTIDGGRIKRWRCPTAICRNTARTKGVEV